MRVLWPRSFLSSLGQLIKVVRPAQMDSTIDQLIEYSGGKDDELRDIAGLGMRYSHRHATTNTPSPQNRYCRAPPRGHGRPSRNLKTRP